MQLQGDVLEQLARLKSEGVKVRTCVTSPPYWGLRDYGTGQWRGGDAECDHAAGRFTTPVSEKQASNFGSGTMQYRDVCGKCGAVRVDNQIGLERTPEEYVAKMVQVFRAVRDVLADDGTIWVNLGDSFAGGKGQSGSRVAEFQEGRNERGDFDNRKIYSCAFVGLSLTLSGIGFGLCQIMSERRYHPSACNANATRQGMPTRSLGLTPHERNAARSSVGFVCFVPPSV